MTIDTDAIAESYAASLGEYLENRSEDALYRATLLSQGCIEAGLGPEEIIAVHVEAFNTLTAARSYREQARAANDAGQFLLEVMIAYGVKYKEYLELRMAETLREAEARARYERERAQEALRLEQEMADVLAIIAHELRTPITAARGTIDLARRSLTQGRVERLEGLLKTAREALDRLSRLSGDLVEASRGEQPELDLVPVQLATVVGQACTWARAAATSKGLRVVCHDPADAEAIAILGDEDALLSVFGNVLSNAIRYTESGGRIDVSYGADEMTAWVAVADTGIGMAPEVQAQIFNRFFRAPDARQREVRGLGLGLSLVQNFVLAHGGTIAVASEVGHGSTFKITLPRIFAQTLNDARSASVANDTSTVSEASGTSHGSTDALADSPASLLVESIDVQGAGNCT